MDRAAVWRNGDLRALQLQRRQLAAQAAIGLTLPLRRSGKSANLACRDLSIG
jgi:hypothetical protein